MTVTLDLMPAVSLSLSLASDCWRLLARNQKDQLGDFTVTLSNVREREKARLLTRDFLVVKKVVRSLGARVGDRMFSLPSSLTQRLLLQRNYSSPASSLIPGSRAAVPVGIQFSLPKTSVCLRLLLALCGKRAREREGERGKTKEEKKANNGSRLDRTVLSDGLSFFFPRLSLSLSSLLSGEEEKERRQTGAGRSTLRSHAVLLATHAGANACTWTALAKRLSLPVSPANITRR